MTIKYSKNSQFFWGILLFLTSTILRFILLNQTTFANGWDSYFYIIQIKSFFEEGQMHSNDVSLIYPLYFIVHFIIQNYELSYKIGAALVAGLYSLSLFYIGIQKHKLMGIMLGVFSISSPHLSYFCSQYPKNLLGIAFFIFFLAFLIQKKWRLAILFFALNFFAHRMGIMLCIIFLSFYVLFSLDKKWIIGLFLTGIGLGLIGYILPGVLSFADFERFHELFSNNFHFPITSFFQLFTSTTLWWKGEIIILFLFLIGSLFIPKTPEYKSFICLFGVLLFPFFEWTLDNIAFRFFMASILLLPLLFMIYTKYLSTKIITSICLFLISIVFFSTQSYNSRKHDPPYLLYQKLTKKINTENIELLIVHKAFAEYFTFYTGIDALPWQVEYPIEKEKLWRITYGIDSQAFQYYLPKNKIYALNHQYTLVREDAWQKMIKLMEKEQDLIYLEHIEKWYNPHQIRPHYLLKNKKN